MAHVSVELPPGPQPVINPPEGAEGGTDLLQPNEARTMWLKRRIGSFFHNMFLWDTFFGRPASSSFDPYLASDSVNRVQDIEGGADPHAQHRNDEGNMWTRTFLRNNRIRSFFHNMFGWVTDSGWLTSSSGTVRENMNGEATGSQRPDEAAAKRIMTRFLLLLGIQDEPELGKLLLHFGIAMGVSLGLSASALVQTTEMTIVAMSIAVAITFTFNGLFLRDNYPNCSTCMLFSGAALMLLSFFALIGLFLPVRLKGILVLCCLVCLFPFATSVWVYFRTGE